MNEKLFECKNVEDIREAFTCEKVSVKEMGKSKLSNKIIVDYILMETEEEDYKKGATGDRQVVLEQNNIGSFSSFKNLVNTISKKYGISSNLTDWGASNDGVLSVSFLVDENNSIATKSEFKNWERGNQRLWVAEAVLYVTFAKTYEPSAEELSERFGIEEY